MTGPIAADVVIVGGGISGVMSAYHLALAGRQVLLIERGVIAGEASGRNGGHVAPSTYDPAQRPLGLLALDLWPRLVEQIELPTEYRQDGSVHAFMESEAELLTARSDSASPEEPVEVWSAQQAREHIPQLAPSIAGAAFRPKIGNVNPILATKAFAHAARALGATIWEGVEVTGVRVERDAIAAVETTRGEVLTEYLVNAAGAWASRIGDMVGLRIPVIPHRLQILLTEDVPHITGATFSGNNIYARQALSGQVHFGMLTGPAWDPPLDRFSRVVTPATMLETARQMAELMPGLADIPILRSWAGVNSITPDTSPIVDAPPEVRGFVIAAGFWNGFGIGVATGQVVSELIVEGKSSVDISGLALRRYSEYPSEVTYPYRRWRAAVGGALESERWPATGQRIGGGDDATG